MAKEKISKGLNYSTWVFERDKASYILFKNNELDDVTDSKYYEMKTYELLEKVGYSIDDYCTYLYKELIVYIGGLISNIENFDANKFSEELKNKNSSIYNNLLEYLEMSRENFFRGLENIEIDSKNEKISYINKAIIYALALSKILDIKNKNTYKYVNNE